MPARPAWLLLVHHLPPQPTRLRVRVWRQLQKLGAVAIKNSVYVLPATDSTLEDFMWLRQEIEAGAGTAVVFRGGAVLETTDSDIIAAFRRDGDTAYARLTSDLDALYRRMTRGRRGPAGPELVDKLETEVEQMRTRFNDIAATDFFKAPGGAQAGAALSRCGEWLLAARHSAGSHSGTGSANRSSRPAALNTADYQGRLWVTRPRPHIDRCASAWLIRRFIDRRARFGFAVEGRTLRGGIPYDMFGAEFSHQGEDCTFETLMKRFGLEHDAGIVALSEIVHDIDLRDSKFGRSEAAGVDAVLRGLTERVRDDRRLLREAAAVLDGLHDSLNAPPRKRKKRNAPRKRK